MSKDNCKTKQITVKFTPDRYKQIGSEATQCNMTLSDYIRKSVDNTAVSYYSYSPTTVRQACYISTEINKMKFTYSGINFENVENGVSKLCAMLSTPEVTF